LTDGDKRRAAAPKNSRENGNCQNEAKSMTVAIR